MVIVQTLAVVAKAIRPQNLAEASSAGRRSPRVDEPPSEPSLPPESVAAVAGGERVKDQRLSENAGGCSERVKPPLPPEPAAPAAASFAHSAATAAPTSEPLLSPE